MSYSIRDSQRGKAYKWEYHLRGESGDKLKRLTPRECQQLAQAVWTTYFDTNDCPTVIVTRAKKSFSSYYKSQNVIKLAAAWGNCRTVLLHEMAHAIVGRFYKDVNIGIQPHGKEFIGVVIDLFEQWAGIDRKTSTLHCIRCGVRRVHIISTKLVERQEVAATRE